MSSSSSSHQSLHGSSRSATECAVCHFFGTAGKRSAPGPGKEVENAFLWKKLLEGDESSVRLALVEMGADANSKNNDGDRPLNVAARVGNIEIAQMLLQNGAGVNEKGKEENTPIMTALHMGNSPEMVKFLVSKGADVNAKIPGDDYPLIVSAFAFGPDLVKFLLENGIDPNTRDLTGRTALHLVVSDSGVVFDRYKTAQLLLDKGAKLKTPDYDDWTPLMYAAQSTWLEIVKLFVGKGDYDNYRNNENRCGLQVAAEAGKKDNVEFLLSKLYYNDLNVLFPGLGSLDAKWVKEKPTRFGPKGLEIREMIAREYGARLVAKGRKQIEEGGRLVRSGEVFLKALDPMPKLDLPKKGVWAAIKEQNVGAVEFMLSLPQMSKNINKKDESGESPLHFAARIGSLEIVKLLAEKPRIDLEMRPDWAAGPDSGAWFESDKVTSPEIREYLKELKESKKS